MTIHTIPYKPNCPASAEVFVGRVPLLKVVLTGLRTAGICYFIVGQPGMGKTSLLNAISRSLIATSRSTTLGHILLPIYIECRRSHHNLADLLQDILQKTLESLMVQQQLECPESIIKEAKNAACQSQNLDSVLKPIFDWSFNQQQQNLLPIILIDDLHRLDKINLLPELASLLQTAVNQQQIALVLAGQDSLIEELRNDVSPLRYLITQTRELEALSLSETQDLIAKSVESGWSVEEGFSNRIYQLTQGHPYRLHYYLFGVLSICKGLTLEVLDSFDTPEQLNHLNRLLDPQAVDAKRKKNGMTTEQAKEIRSCIRDNQLQNALKLLGENEQHKSSADIFFFQLKSIADREKAGTVSPIDVNVEHTRIAEQVLKLIN